MSLDDPIQDDLGESDEVALDPDEDTESTINEVSNTRQLKSQMSSVQGLTNFIKGNIGTGILSMPMVLKYAGIWLGLSLIVTTSTLATYCMHLLARVAEDLTQKHTINGFLIVTQVGFCCVYTLFLTQNILLFIQEILPANQQQAAADPKWFYITAFLVCAFLTPIAIFRSMRMITYFSLVANVCMLLGLLFIFIYIGYVGLKPVDQLPSALFGRNLLVGFSIVVFSVEGIGLVLPIQSKMLDPGAFHDRRGVINTGMTIIVCLYCAIAFFGYVAFGDKVQSTITLNVNVPPYAFSLVKPFFIVATFGSYLIQFYLPIVIIGRLMEKLSWHRNASETRRSVHKKLMRAVLIWFAFAAAITIPHIDLMISLIGSLASSFLAFILPPILYLVRFWPHRHVKPRFNLSIFYGVVCILFGLLALFGGSISTIIEIIKVSKSSKDKP